MKVLHFLVFPLGIVTYKPTSTESDWQIRISASNLLKAEWMKTTFQSAQNLIPMEMKQNC